MTDNLSGFTLEGVLLLIGLQKRTGELVVESGNNIGSVIFHEGKILQAFSPYTRAIGDLLVEDGILTETELLEVLKLQKNDSRMPLGAMLMNTGKVAFEAIEMMVHEQIRQAVKEFKTWIRINITFVDKDIEPVDAVFLPVHEFIPSDILTGAYDAVSRMISLKGKEQIPSEPS